MSGSHSSGRPPFIGARVYRATDQTIATDTQTPLSFSAERYDNGGFWVVGAPTLLTIPTGLGGYYLVHGNFQISPSGQTLMRQLLIVLNELTAIAVDRIGVSGGTTNLGSVALQASVVWRFAAGDFVTLTVEQSSGGNMDVIASESHSPEFGLAFLGA